MADYGAFVEDRSGRRGPDPRIAEMSWSQHLRSRTGLHEGGRRGGSRCADPRPRRAQDVASASSSSSPDPWADIETKYAVGSRHTRQSAQLHQLRRIRRDRRGRRRPDPHLRPELDQEGANILQNSRKSVPTSKSLSWKSTKTTAASSLGHKQLEENPWNAFEQQFAVDSIHTGTITELNDKGAVVSLGDNVEGFAPAKQLAKEDGTTGQSGRDARIQGRRVLRRPPSASSCRTLASTRRSNAPRYRPNAPRRNVRTTPPKTLSRSSTHRLKRPPWVISPAWPS